MRPHVVQTWMYHSDLLGGVVARLAGIRNVVWGIRHSDLSPNRNKRSTIAIAKICAKISSIVPRRIVSCSLAARKLHIERGYVASKFVDIANGYRFDVFRPDEQARERIRKELSIECADFVFGMVARFDLQKDHKNLIDALQRLKAVGRHFVCVLVGTDMNAENDLLGQWITEAGIKACVRLLGPRRDVPALMNAIDLKVLSSAGEAFPNVLAEAMACGTPCVTTDVGDAAVIVDRFGWVVPAQDSEALADAMCAAQDLRAQRPVEWEMRCGEGTAHIAQNFSLERMWNSYYSVWSECRAS